MNELKFNNNRYHLKIDNNTKKEFHLDNEDENKWSSMISMDYLYKNKNITPLNMLNMYVESFGNKIIEKPNIFTLKEKENDLNSNDYIIANILIEDKVNNGENILEFNTLKLILENDSVKIYRFAIKANEFSQKEVEYIINNVSNFIKEIDDLYIPHNRLT